MLNKVMMMGRLTADPEMKTTQNGSSLCNFRIACARPKKKDSDEQETDFFNCTAWSGTAEVVNSNYKKGDIILLSGYLRNSTYEKNGEKRTNTEIVAKEIHYLYPTKKPISRIDTEHFYDDTPPTPEQEAEWIKADEERFAEMARRKALGLPAEESVPF